MHNHINNSLYMWRYYTVSKEKYNHCLKVTLDENINTLSFYSKSLTFMLGCLSIAVAIMNYTNVAPYLSYYRDNDRYLHIMLISTCIAAVIAMYFSHMSSLNKNHGKRMGNVSIYVHMVLFYAFTILNGIYMSVWSSPDAPAIIILLLIACANFLVIAPPQFNMLLTLSATAALIISSILLNPASILIVNTLNVIPAAVIGIIIPWYVNMRRMQGLSVSLELEHERKQLTELYAKEKDFYFTQCQIMQESVEAVKSAKHDIKMHLFALKEYMAENKAAMAYLNSLVDDISESDAYSNTGNLAVDSVINFKLKNAIDDNIKLNIKTALHRTINVEAVDIVTILGNLLDNALDAVAKADEKRIDVAISYNKGVLIIQVDNTFDGIVNYLQCKGDTKRNIITRKNGDNHGYGLKNIAKSVEKYNGHMEISHDRNVFTVEIMLYTSDM